MLQQIIDEAPQFFGYYNVLFLLQAFAATFLLSLAGCVLGRAIPAGVVATKSPAALRCSRRASSIPSASVAPTKGPSAGTKRAPPRAIAARVPEDDTADASLKILWLKARRPDAVLMLRAPQPLPPMGVLPVKLA